MGAGGSGRGVVFALAQAGIETVTLVNRTLSRAEGLAGEVMVRFPDVAIEAYQQGPDFVEYDLLVNCTSIGMRHSPMEGYAPVELKGIRAGALVCDLVYNPQETALLKLAKEAGAWVLGGLPMLIFQGAIAFDLWFERKAPVEVMFEAARKALR
jgi:shikimate dehydrogenase